MSASVTVPQMRFVGFVLRIWVKGEKKARLGYRLRKEFRGSRIRELSSQASGQ